MIIRESCKLEKRNYWFENGEGIIIEGNDITVDGQGAFLIGPGSLEKGKESFLGTGITIRDAKNVYLKNLIIKGFQIAVYLQNCQNIRIENNDLSDNFNDPDFGWGDGEAYGALLMEECTECHISRNRGQHVWNGIHLRHCHDNVIMENDFSHCSNVCLAMWDACRNLVKDNIFSWGLRIKPGEVHARDSASLLIEHGSNENRFIHNDFSHGGDGIFIRSLDGVISTGNTFEGNECSYANNNAVECWSPGNTFIRNKANYSSYGFWMGGSDHTRMEENEAAYNGTCFHNAPEKDFGNAGVAVVHGSSTHFILQGNHIHDNQGCGIAIGYKKEYPACHWLIQNNVIQNNSSHGIYIRDAEGIRVVGNAIEGNGGQRIFYNENVSEIFVEDKEIGNPPPKIEAAASALVIRIGEEIVFDGSKSHDTCGRDLCFHWDLSDGKTAETSVVRHKYEKEGFYKVSVEVSNGESYDIDGFEIYVYKHGKY